MEDSDSDFSDAGEDHIDNSKKKKTKVNEKGLKVRGDAQSWVEIFKFPNSKKFHDSEIAKKLEVEFSRRKYREFEFADVAEYECKFRRRVGIIPCPYKIKVLLFFYFSDLYKKKYYLGFVPCPQLGDLGGVIGECY